MEKLYEVKNKIYIAIHNFIYTIMNTSDYAMWQQDEYGSWIYVNEEIDTVTG